MKKTLSVLAIYCIVGIMLSLVYILIPFSKPTSSWIVYAFALASLVGGMLINWVAFRKAETLKSKLYGIPLIRLGLIYTCTQIAISIIFIIIGAFIDVPLWSALLVSLLILGVTAIGTIIGDNLRDIVEEIEAKEISSKCTIIDFQNRIAYIADICQEEEVKAKIEVLADKLKYSDPVSSKETKEIESRIDESMEQLQEHILAKEMESALKCVENLTRLVSSRNRICRTNK